jgi:hypothetical protein
VAVLDPLPAFTPTSAYVQKKIGGFTVLVHPAVMRDGNVASQAFAELELQMDRIAAALPEHLLAKLREARIWIEWRQREDTASQFHIARAWLLEHAYNPDKAGDVEICDVRNSTTPCLMCMAADGKRMQQRTRRSTSPSSLKRISG